MWQNQLPRNRFKLPQNHTKIFFYFAEEEKFTFAPHTQYVTSIFLFLFESLEKLS